MLQAQVNYWTLQEQKRHNLETERQGEYGLRIQEGSLKENIRHNQAIEGYNYGNLAESIRHNTAMESYNWSDLSERTRHNTETESLQSTSNQIQYVNARESIRHNQAVETENEKHNRAVEDETRRSNKAVEQETNRSNVARETETTRHNLATETQTDFKNTIDAGVSQRNATSNERQAAAAESRAGAEWYNAKSKRAQTWVDGVTRVLDTFGGMIKLPARAIGFLSE